MTNKLVTKMMHKMATWSEAKSSKRIFESKNLKNDFDAILRLNKSFFINLKSRLIYLKEACYFILILFSLFF